MAVDDIELIVRIARGDRGALGELYDRYAGVMNALAQRTLRDSQEAEDVLHDVFLEVWKHAGDYDPRHASVGSWLIVRLRSRCLDRLRWHRRRRHTREDDAQVVSPVTPPLQADAIDGNRVREALADLRAEQRRVIELVYFHGLSAREIAAQLELPVGTVKSRVSAGILHLRRVLDPQPLTWTRP